MTNVKLILAYDGTLYYGWQKTNAGPSIEETLEKVLNQIFQHDIVLQAASRTDRGVHAEGQVVNFFTTHTLVNTNKIQFQLNALLPKNIRVLNIAIVPQSFHPTMDVIEKTYTYDLSLGVFQMPCERHYAWHVYRPLDIPLMQKATKLFEGTHDFEGFTNRKIDENYKDYIRTIYEIDILEQSKNCLRIVLTGNHFLYKMARNIVGTLVFIGCKKLPIHVIHEVLSQKNRALAGMTPPAHGLTLRKIKYAE